MTDSASNAADVDPDLVTMIDAVFANYRESHPPTGSIARDAELWLSLDQLGLLRLSGSERSGGSGADWYESAALITAAVRHGVRIPLAEHDMLACWLLEAVGAPIDQAARTVCVLDTAGNATAVPWASTAERIVVVWPDGQRYLMTDADCTDLRIVPGTNLIGEPRDSVSADIGSLTGTAVSAELVEQLRLKSALVRSIQVCAALTASSNSLSITHRRAFNSAGPCRSFRRSNISSLTSPPRPRWHARLPKRLWPPRSKAIGRLPNSASSSRWRGPAPGTQPRSRSETATRPWAPSAPPSNTGYTNTPVLHWPGVRSSDLSVTGTRK